MQNTVIERNALNLSSNAYMNSTTKFVKGMNINPQVIEHNKNPTIIASTKSIHQFQKVQPSNILNNIIAPSSSKHIGQRKKQQKSEEKHQQSPQTISPIQLIAMNLSANIFMNSTTKFVKGFVDLAPLNKSGQKQKKDVLIKKEVGLTRRQKSHKKSVSPQPVIDSVQKIGLDMTAANYMTSTTKYIKQGALVESAIGTTQKALKSQRSISNKKLQQTLNRNRFITEHEVDKSISKSDSESRISRKRKDRTQDLKFIQPKYSNQSQSTIKDHPNIRQQNTNIQEHNVKKEQKIEAQKQSNAKVPINKHNQVNIKKLPTSLTNIPTQKKINRNQIKEIKSSDTKKIQKKQENQRPFTRQPQNIRPHLITTQKIQEKQEKFQNDSTKNIPQQSNNKNKKIERIKSQKIVRNEQLLLQTPVKNQQLTKRNQQQEQKQVLKTKPIPISIIKQQRSSMINTKNSIQNSNNKVIKQQAKKSHINQAKQSIIRANQQIGKKQQQVKQIQVNQKNGNNLGKIRSEPTIKIQDKLQQTITIASKKPIIRNNNIQSQTSKTRIKNQVKNQLQIKKGKINIQKCQEQIQLKSQSQALLHFINNESNKSPQKSIQKDKIAYGKRINENQYIEQISLKASIPAIKNREIQAKIEETSKRVIVEQQNNKLITQQKQRANKQVKSVQIICQDQKNNSLKAKSSKAVLFLLQRLYTRTVQVSLNKIKSTISYTTKHLPILYYEIAKIQKQFYKAQLQTAFDALKKLLLSTNIIKKPISNTNNKQIASSLIFRSLISKQREFFQDITWASKHHIPSLKSTQKNLMINAKQHIYHIFTSAFHVIQTYQKDRLRINFYQICMYAYNRKNIKLQKPIILQTLNIFKKPQKPLRNNQLQKQNLLKQKAQTESSINLIEQNISNKKYYSDIQKSKLIKKQSELIQKNKMSQKQGVEKRNKSKQIIKRMEQDGLPSDLDITLPQSQPLVSLITEIYSWAFNSSTDRFNVQDLRDRYSLNKQEQSTLLKQWEHLLINSKLKSKISQWQRQNPLHQSYKKSINEKEIAQNVLRSYVRQRYLWQWVKIAAQNQ